jgi:amino-acid N-acetyltransferase
MISMLNDDTIAADFTRNSGESIMVRKAAMSDIGPILALINDYAAKGIMLPRTEFEMSENIRDFSVALCGEKLAGCGALHFYSPTMGEIRSLAVSEDWKTHGVGRKLVEALVSEAAGHGLDAVFAFTYVPGFFEKLGFVEVERGELPLKAWKDCLRCPKFQSCDELAMLRVLDSQRWRETDTRIWGYQSSSTGEWEPDVLLPILRQHKL